MRSNLSNLDGLLARARSGGDRDGGRSGASAGGSDRAGSGAGGRAYSSEKDRVLDEALAYFGWSRSPLPTLTELGRKYRELQRDLHRRNPTGKEAEEKRVNVYRDHIRDFLKEVTHAAA